VNCNKDSNKGLERGQILIRFVASKRNLTFIIIILYLYRENGTNSMIYSKYRELQQKLYIPDTPEKSFPHEELLLGKI